MQQLRAQYHSLTANLPAPIVTFVLRALALLLAYEAFVWLVPAFEQTLNPILCVWNGEATAQVMRWLGYASTAQAVGDGAYIYNGAQACLSVAEGCNAYTLLLMWGWLVISYPVGSFWQRVGVLFGGAAIIAILNIVRIVLLMFTFMYAPEYLDVNHHYIFKIAIYAAIFFMWTMWIKRSLTGSAGSPAAS